MNHEGRWIDAKWGGTCSECEKTIEIGDRIGWIPSQKSSLCSQCAPGFIGEDPEDNGETPDGRHLKGSRVIIVGGPGEGTTGKVVRSGSIYAEVLVKGETKTATLFCCNLQVVGTL